MAKDAAFRRVKDEDDFRIRFQELQAQASDPVERNYVLGRFRALREAMVVQHRQVDQLTREVYERNMAICLEQGHFFEFTICATQLLKIYAQLMKEFPGDTSLQRKFLEVCSLRLLQQVHIGSIFEINKIYYSLSRSQRQSQAVKIAMNTFRCIRASEQHVNFHKIWRLLESASSDQLVFLELIIPTIRKRVLDILTKAYYSVEEEFLAAALGMTDVDKAVELLKETYPNCTFSTRNGVIQLKQRRRA